MYNANEHRYVPHCIQEGRKPNRKSETEPESPKTEPVTVYKETGETGTEETETAVCKKWYLCTVRKWVKLNRAEVLVPPSDAEFCAFSENQGLGLPTLQFFELLM